MRSGLALVLLEQIDAFLWIISRNPINAQSPLGRHSSLLSPPSSPSGKDWVGLQASAVLPPSSSSESHSVMSDSLQPHGLYSPWNSPGQNTGVDSPFPSRGDLPNPGIKPRSPTLQVDSLPAELQGKPLLPAPLRQLNIFNCPIGEVLIFQGSKLKRQTRSVYSQL